ncbi:MAG: hypothetical protein ACOYOB_07875 [Myxococcota bacterium]
MHIIAHAPRILALVLTAATAVACANTDNGGGGTVADTNTTDFSTTDTTAGTDSTTGTDSTVADTSGASKTVAELQAMKTACATPPVAFDNFLNAVMIRDVIVTSPMRLTTGYEGVFVQDDGGGENSGIYVMMKGTATALADVKPGDVLTIVGDAKEYYCFTELQATSVVPSGETKDPVAVKVTPAQLDEKASMDLVEPFEGVLVELENVVVSNPLANGTDSKPHGAILVGADENSPTVRIASGFGKVYMTEYDKTSKVYSEKYPKGTKIKSIKGVIEYTYGAFQLLPVEEPILE